MKKLIGLLMAGVAAVAVATRADVIFAPTLASETSLAHDATFQADLQDLRLVGLTGQAAFTSAATASPVTFQDGRQSTGSITVTDFSVLSATSATNTLTVASTSNLVGASITLPGAVFRQGIDWAVGATVSATAESIQAALQQVTILQVTRIGAVITLRAPVGTLYNTYGLTASVPSSLVAATPTFTGGRNNAIVTINGLSLTQGTQWSAGGSTIAAAASLASAINGSALGATITATATGGGSINLISNANGATFNYLLSSSVAAITLSGASMTGGVTPDITVGSQVIRIAAHGLSLGLPVLYTGSPAISPLTAGTTYFAIPVDSNSIRLATSKSNAVAGTAITFTSIAPHLTASVGTLSSLSISGTPSFKWQDSDDGLSWADMAFGSVTMTSYATPPRTVAWNFGQPSKRFIRANVVAPTTGGIALQLSLRGANSIPEDFSNNAYVGDGSGLTGVPGTISGSSSITTTSSVTASAFFGNGSGLTGVTGTDSTKVAKTGDTMTGQLTLAASSLTVNGNVLITTNNNTPNLNAIMQVSSGTNSAFVVYRSSVINYVQGANIPLYQGRVFNGTLAAPTAVLANQQLVAYAASGYDGTNWVAPSAGSIGFFASSNWTSANHGTSVLVQGVGTGQTAQKIYAIWGTNGALGLGTTAKALNPGIVGTDDVSFDNGGAAYFGSGVAKTTITVLGSINLSSAAVLTSLSSVTASGFFGDGAGLVNVTGTDSTKVAKTGDTMTGQLTIAGSSLTVGGRIRTGGSNAPDLNAQMQISSGTGTSMVVYGSSVVIYHDQGPNSTIYQGRAYTGTLTSPSPVAANQAGAAFGMSGYDGSTWVDPSPSLFFCNASNGVWSTSNHGSVCGVLTTGQNQASRTLVAVFGTNGTLGLGTSVLAGGISGTRDIALDVGGGAFFGSGVAKTTITVLGSINLSSAAVLNSLSSVTASGFFGNGSGLTGVSGTDTTKVAKTGDTMTGTLTMSNADISLTGASGFITGQSSVTASGFFGSSLDIGGNTVYYCTGSTAGTFDGNLARGNANAGACAGGTWVATSLKVN